VWHVSELVNGISNSTAKVVSSARCEIEVYQSFAASWRFAPWRSSNHHVFKIKPLRQFATFAHTGLHEKPKPLLLRSRRVAHAVVFGTLLLRPAPKPGA